MFDELSDDDADITAVDGDVQENVDTGDGNHTADWRRAMKSVGPFEVCIHFYIPYFSCIVSTFCN